MCQKYINCFTVQCHHEQLSREEIQVLLEKWCRGKKISTLKKGQKLKFTHLENGSIKVEIVEP